jgi:hypothetical protein
MTPHLAIEMNYICTTLVYSLVESNSRRLWYWGAIRFLNGHVAWLAVLTAVPKKVIWLVRPISNGIPTPTLFQLTAYPIPFMMKFSTQSLLNNVHLLRQTEPWLLAKCEVSRNYVFQRTVSTVLAFFLICSTSSIWNIIYSSLVLGVVCHLIVNASRQLYRFILMQNVVKVWNQSLECHEAIERAHQTTPSNSFLINTYLDYSNKLIIRFHIWTQNKKAALYWFVCSTWADHVIFKSEIKKVSTTTEETKSENQLS